MHLKKWFEIKATRPLQFIFAIAFLIWIGFAFLEYQSQKTEIERRMTEVEKQISLSISQSNRPFLEFIVENTFHQFKARSIALCVEDKMEIEINTREDLCLKKPSFQTFTQEIRGFKNIRLVVEGNILDRILLYLAILLLLSGMILFILKLIGNLRRDLYADIIQPIGQILTSDQELKIQEINDIREKLKDALVAENNLATANVMVSLSKQVAHDIRSPLSALGIVFRSLDNLPEDKRSLIHDSIQRVNGIANELLIRGKEIASSQQKSLSPKKEIIYLPNLVQKIIEEKRLLYLDRPEIAFCTDYKNEDLAMISADEGELMRLLSNLMNNSVEAFSQAGGEITISIRVYAEKVQLSVNDNGSGIPEEILANLGTPGFSYGKTSANSGLGLSHAKSYLESLGSKLTISSKVGMGTSIEMTFKREV